MDITTRSGKVLENPSKDKSVVYNIDENIVKADCDDSIEVEIQDGNIHDTTPRCQQSKRLTMGSNIKRKWWRKLFQIYHHLFLRDRRRRLMTPRSVLIDLRVNELSFRLNEEVVRFDVSKSMKHPKDMNVFSITDVYHEHENELSLDKQLTVEPLAAMILNFEHEDVEEYEETLCVLTGMGSYSYTHRKLDFDLKN
ncbi:hypothetical protein CQW23_21322 [Capsicum baccatum]|uniref:Uncharacterized protein n=1 Tax=Capsicum baccatum TaxID=33114 RepID=A0A2G2VXR5_CAPBA|nr:hypothetical protein CQW23_21322 [Capsicum baccatum]